MAKEAHPNVQNVGHVSSGSGITRGGRKVDGPEDQKVSKQTPAPSPVRMPGQGGSGPALTRKGPISRAGS